VGGWFCGGGAVVVLLVALTDAELDDEDAAGGESFPEQPADAKAARTRTATSGRAPTAERPPAGLMNDAVPYGSVAVNV
jgi:hypothetical protein